LPGAPAWCAAAKPAASILHRGAAARYGWVRPRCLRNRSSCSAVGLPRARRATCGTAGGCGPAPTIGNHGPRILAGWIAVGGLRLSGASTRASRWLGIVARLAGLSERVKPILFSREGKLLIAGARTRAESGEVQYGDAIGRKLRLLLAVRMERCGLLDTTSGKGERRQSRELGTRNGIQCGRHAGHLGRP
jgi:hypothetical protein